MMNVKQCDNCVHYTDHIGSTGRCKNSNTFVFRNGFCYNWSQNALQAFYNFIENAFKDRQKGEQK